MRHLETPRPIIGHRIQVTPFSPALGAEIRGVDLASGIDEETSREIRSALCQFGVLFFKEQSEIAPAVQVAIGRLFGELHMHPAAPQMSGFPEVFVIHTARDSTIANGEFWHSDVSCDEEPPLGTILQIHVLPQIGGDTLFANMHAAYDALSDPVKKMIGELTAIHASEHVYRGRYAERGVDDRGRTYPQASHPVVRTHPETGRKAIFVNRTFTTRINELTAPESKAILEMLFAHCEQVDFQIRFRWSRNDVAFWDNRSVIHHAIWDYWPHDRTGRRVTIKGDRPR
jgi:taurine dioxygenase